MTSNYQNHFGADIRHHLVANVCDVAELLKRSLIGNKYVQVDSTDAVVDWTHTQQTDKTAVFEANATYTYLNTKKAYVKLTPVTRLKGSATLGTYEYIPGKTKIGDKSYTVFREYPVYTRSEGFPDRTLPRSVWAWVTDPVSKQRVYSEIVYSNIFDTKWYDSVGMYKADMSVDGLTDFNMNAMSINAVAYTLPRMAKYLNYRNWRLRLLINAAVSTMVDKFVITYPTTDTVVQGVKVYSYTLTKDKFFQSFLTSDTKFTSGKTYYHVDGVTGKLVQRPVSASEIGTDIPETETLYERYSTKKTYYTRSVDGARETYTAYVDEAGAPIRNETSLVYKRSTDTTVDPTKHYYTTEDYVNFTEVHPTGTESPLNLGWYELANTDYATYYEQSYKYKTEYHEVEGHFVLTTDTEAQESKTYYICEDKRESSSAEHVYQFTAVHLDTGSEIPSNTYYELEIDPASVKWMGNREDPQTHRFYVKIAAGANTQSGYTYVVPGGEGEEYKTCSVLVEPSGKHFYTRTKNKVYMVTSDTVFSTPTKTATGYVATKQYYIQTGAATYRAAVMGTKAKVLAGEADYVQDNYEFTTDSTFADSKKYYLRYTENEIEHTVEAIAGTAIEVEKGVADYVIGSTVPANTFYDCVGPTSIVTCGKTVCEYKEDGTYTYSQISTHVIGHIRDDAAWDHYILDDNKDAIGTSYGYDTVIVGLTKNGTGSDDVLYRQLIVGDDTSIMTTKYGYLYVDAQDEVLTRVKNALNVFMTYYRTTLLMSGRSGTAFRAITGNTQYTTEDIITRLNSIIGSINEYADNPIATLNEDEYTVRNLKLKVNEVIEYIVNEEYYYNLCNSSYERNLLNFEEDFWEDFMDGGSLQYTMATTSCATSCCYNDALFYYDPHLAYLSYAYNNIQWGTLYTSGDPEVGMIKKESVPEVLADETTVNHDYYSVFVGKYPNDDTGTYYGWIPLHQVVNVYRIADNWFHSQYAAAMQVLRLTKNLLETKTPDGNDWKTALTNPRKRGSTAAKFSSVLQQINNMEARIEMMLKIAPEAARVITDITHWCASYNYSSMEQCFPYGK